jgi:predicted dienelactone hydrolase
MILGRALWLALAVVGLMQGCGGVATGQGGRGSASTPKVITAAWRPEGFSREIPVKVFLPDAARWGGDGPRPMLVFSHGGGGTREGFDEMAPAFVEAGYVVVVPQHESSDRSVLLTGGLKETISDPAVLRERPLEITAVINEALRRSASERWAVRPDDTRIAVMGHSFGAYTAMAVGGMTVDLTPGEQDVSFLDDRVGLVIALSPQGTGQMGISSNAWDGVSVAVLMITGTRDEGFEEGQDPAWRREGFESLSSREEAPPVYLAVVQDADHLDFAMRERRRGGRSRDAALEAVRVLSLEACRAFLEDDAEALLRLEEGAYERESGGVTTVTAG